MDETLSLFLGIRVGAPSLPAGGLRGSLCQSTPCWVCLPLPTNPCISETVEVRPFAQCVPLPACEPGLGKQVMSAQAPAILCGLQPQGLIGIHITAGVRRVDPGNLGSSCCCTLQHQLLNLVSFCHPLQHHMSHLKMCLF